MEFAQQFSFLPYWFHLLFTFRDPSLNILFPGISSLEVLKLYLFPRTGVIANFIPGQRGVWWGCLEPGVGQESGSQPRSVGDALWLVTSVVYTEESHGHRLPTGSRTVGRSFPNLLNCEPQRDIHFIP